MNELIKGRYSVKATESEVPDPELADYEQAGDTENVKGGPLLHLVLPAFHESRPTMYIWFPNKPAEGSPSK